MKNSGILTKSSLIDNPFRKDVTNKYAFTAMELVRSLKGEDALDYLLKTIYNNYLNISMSKNELLNYLTNEHEWMHGFLYITICEIGKELTGDKDFYYHVGKSSLNPNFLHITTAKILSLNTVYRYIQLQNKNFNNLTDIQIDKNRFENGFAVFYKKTHNWYKNELENRYGKDRTLKILHNDCELTKGVLEGVPIRYKKKDAKVVNEPCCEGTGDNRCEIHLEWAPESLKEKIKGAIFILPRYTETRKKIIQMEAVIKERTEQLEQSKKEIESAYSRIKLLKDALGEKESEALLNAAFSYLDENKFVEAERAFDLIINKKDTLVYQYETPSLFSIFFFNKKKIGKLREVWTIKRYANQKDAYIAYQTYKKLAEHGKLANVKVPKCKPPVNKYLIVQEINGISLYDLFSKYMEYKKSTAFSKLLTKHISDTAFIQSLHFRYEVTHQNYSDKLTKSLQMVFNYYGIRFELSRIRNFSRQITKNFTKGLIRHRDSSLKNTKLKLLLPRLKNRKPSDFIEYLYQIDFEKMGRFTFLSDNVLRITESPLFLLSDREKLWYHYLFLLFHTKYISRRKEKKIDAIIAGGFDNVSKEVVSNIVGIKKFHLYFLAHNEKVFYRHLRSMYHQLKPSNKSIIVEHLNYHRKQALISLEKIKGNSFSERFKEDIDYIESRLLINQHKSG